MGNLWFDNDSNNDTVTDTDPQLDAYWHFDYSTPVAAGKSDFYSVALHEMLHVLGFGIGQSWNSNVSGTTWLGSEVSTLMGTGTGMVDGGGAHVASGVTSPRLSDGILQETVMSPSIVVGTRKTLAPGSGVHARFRLEHHHRGAGTGCRRTGARRGGAVAASPAAKRRLRPDRRVDAGPDFDRGGRVLLFPVTSPP